MSYYAYDKKIYPSDGLSPTVAALPSYQAARDRHKLIFGPDSGLATVVNSITGATILRANVIKPLEITDLNFRSPNVIAGSETHVSVEAVANGIVVCQPSVEFPLYKAEILTQQHCSFSRKKIVTVIHSSDQNIHFSATKSGACQMRVSVENGNLYKNLSITIK